MAKDFPPSAATEGRSDKPTRWLTIASLIALSCSNAPEGASESSASTSPGGTTAVGTATTTNDTGADSVTETTGQGASVGSAVGGTVGTVGGVGGSPAAGGASNQTSNTSAGGGSSIGGSASTGQGGQGGTQGGTANETTVGAGGSASSSTVGGGGTSSVGTSNCTASTLTMGDSNRTVDVGGTSRSYILHVPSSYDGTTPVPLVLDFHGLGGNGSQQESSSGYRQVADQEGFLVAFPDGIDNAWNIGPCCTNSRDVDDLGFAKGMVESISIDGCVDLRRVYATGFSMGGGMSHFLGCQAADVFAAVQPSAFDLLDPEDPPCAPSRPISVMSWRGTADTVVPFEGGPGSGGRVVFLGAEQTFERWSEINGCVEPTASDGNCTYYEQCDAGVKVGLCVQEGGGHAPGDASIGWGFLSQFSLP